MKYYWLDIETYLFWSTKLNKAYTSKVHYEVKKEPNVDKFIVVFFFLKNSIQIMIYGLKTIRKSMC